jgi:glyoxylase-like metal-dependent hydrolase (beta-lactamase superfamily II)
VRAIDVRHRGRERVICCFDVDGVLVDPGPESSMDTLLAGLEGERPRALALTHIHLDHAGAAGALVRRFPELEVWVHEVGAPHLVDPSKLISSATRLYGDEMEELWGEILPVPEANLRVLSGGETIDGFRVAYTPGHAWHHVSYLHEESGTAFVGDVAGVRIQPSDLTIAPTPPPEIDIEAWHESVAKVREWAPRRLALTHFGEVEDPGAQLDALVSALEEQARRAREIDQDEFIAWLHADIAARADAETVAAIEQAAIPEHLYLGLERYWRKRDERG